MILDPTTSQLPGLPLTYHVASKSKGPQVGTNRAFEGIWGTEWTEVFDKQEAVQDVVEGLAETQPTGSPKTPP